MARCSMRLRAWVDVLTEASGFGGFPLGPARASQVSGSPLDGEQADGPMLADNPLFDLEGGVQRAGRDQVFARVDGPETVLGIAFPASSAATGPCRPQRRPGKCRDRIPAGVRRSPRRRRGSGTLPNSSWSGRNSASKQFGICRIELQSRCSPEAHLRAPLQPSAQREQPSARPGSSRSRHQARRGSAPSRRRVPPA